MIKKIINGSNLQKACQKVMSNKGSAGIDGMPVQELSAYLGINKEQYALAIEGTSEADTISLSKSVAAYEANKEEIINAILNGSYQPQAILGVEIPKDNGRKRLLGIPTACYNKQFIRLSTRNSRLSLKFTAMGSDPNAAHCMRY